MPLPHLISSLRCCPHPADLPYCQACRIPISSAPLRLPKYLLTWTSIGYPLPSASTTGPVSSPRLHTPSPSARRLQIFDRGSPTVPPSLDVYRCMYLWSSSPPPSKRSRPLPATRFHTVTYLSVSTSPAVKTLYVTPLYSSPQPLAGPTSLLWTKEPPVQMLYKRLPEWMGPPPLASRWIIGCPRPAAPFWWYVLLMASHCLTVTAADPGIWRLLLIWFSLLPPSLSNWTPSPRIDWKFDVTK